jgi:hypothetical protein
MKVDPFALRFVDDSTVEEDGFELAVPDLRFAVLRHANRDRRARYAATRLSPQRNRRRSIASGAGEGKKRTEG